MFTLDADKTPYTWTARQNIPALAREARLAAAHVLAQLAVLRVAEPAAEGRQQQQQLQQQQRAFESVEEAVMRLAQSDLQQQRQDAAGSGG